MFRRSTCPTLSGYQNRSPEVLVIGGGAAALSAAIAARRAGAQVRLLEAATPALRGGNTRHARNVRFMHETPSPFAAERYPAAEFAADLARATGGSADPVLAERLIDASATLPDWLASVGVAVQRADDGRLPFSRKTLFFLGGGKALLNALYQCAAAEGVQIHYRQEVTDLRLEGQRVSQLQVDTPTALECLHPSAVIAACGAAQANRDWLRAQLGQAVAGLINRGTPHAQGAVLLSLLAQGVQSVGDPRRLYLVAVDARSPPDDGGIVTRVRGMPAGIVVDAQAQRFDDEGADTASTRYSAWGQRLVGVPGQIAWLILDAAGEQAAPTGVYPPLRAATPEALALRLGLDPQRLAKTLSDYNAATHPPRSGADPSGWHTLGLTPAKSTHAKPLCQPPFAAYPMRPGVTFTQHGLAVDARWRVLDAERRPIENLFAAGMIMAANLIGNGYLSGLALSIGLVLGRLAGEEAARYVIDAR